jgi:flagellar protein FlbB
MAGGSGTFFRILILLFLILILTAGGIFWFDYLNVIDAKTVLSPVYRLVGMEGRTQEELPAGGPLNLNDERYAVLLEALDLRNQENERLETDIRNRQGQIEQMAQDLEERQKALEDQIKSSNAGIQEAEDKDRNDEQNARNMVNMPPERAVGILVAMDDQNVIDILRKTEEIAQAEGSNSIVPYWLSLMPSERAAEITRKMAARPPGF